MRLFSLSLLSEDLGENMEWNQAMVRSSRGLLLKC